MHEELYPLGVRGHSHEAAIKHGRVNDLRFTRDGGRSEALGRNSTNRIAWILVQ